MPPRTHFATFDEAFAWLAARTNYETMAVQRYDARTYGLARVVRLLRALGRPDRAFDAAQVVGSKGKGSTATALASILRASGRRVGLFTSPHLIDPRERIRVDGEPVADRMAADALAELVPHADAAILRREPLTFFELHTAAALLAFRAAGCDAVVLEAGMGGRLDATSAARARVKVLTSVSLDHTQQLGRTRTAIAAEKAAAARRGVPFVSGERPGSAVGRVVAAACRDAGAPLVAIGRDFAVRRVRCTFDAATGRGITSFRLLPDGQDFEVPLVGRHQATNAALAVVAARTAGWSGGRPDALAVRAGLDAVRIRARFETIATSPLVIVDGAHTPASFAALTRTLDELLPGRRRVLVVGMSSDKDVRGAISKIVDSTNHLIATTSGQSRAADPSDIVALARAAGVPASARPDVAGALAAARAAAGPRGVVVVTGSLYLCGEVLRLST